MTTPQTIVWTHVDDEAPPRRQLLLCNCAGSNNLIWSNATPLRNLSSGADAWVARSNDGVFDILHWAIITPPSTTTAAQTKEQ